VLKEYKNHGYFKLNKVANKQKAAQGCLFMKRKKHELSIPDVSRTCLVFKIKKYKMSDREVSANRRLKSVYCLKKVLFVVLSVLMLIFEIIAVFVFSQLRHNDKTIFVRMVYWVCEVIKNTR
jgi:hypothetical protein